MSLIALFVNLDDGTHRRERLPDAVSQDYLGGRGAAVWLLRNRLPEGAGGSSRNNLLIFSAGPLAGTDLPASGEVVISTRSPLTGSVAHSWAEGTFGAALRRAGYDMLVITGQSAAWCVVQIENNRIAIEHANDLLGSDTVLTTDQLLLRYGDRYAVACIGPAGEAGVAYAGIVIDGLLMAEPAGTGAVMAAKRVKAVVIQGDTQRPVADSARAKAVTDQIAQRLAGNEHATGVRVFGSTQLITAARARNALTMRNSQAADPSTSVALTRTTLAQRGRRGGFGCVGCPVPCHSRYIRKDGGGTAYPSLEVLLGFGASCGITRPDALIRLGDLCLRLGLDVASTSAAIGFLMECQEQGLARQQTLSWGDDAAVIAAIERLGVRAEKRDALSLGVGELQEVFYGSEAFAPHARRLALPPLDLRALPLAALAVATAPIGGDLRANMVFEELLTTPPAWIPGKPGTDAATRLIWHERFAAALDSAGLCRRLALLVYIITPNDLAELLSAVHGRTWSGADLARLGERIITAERIFARTHAIEPDDRLPERWRSEQLDALIQEYYRRHGWDEHGDPPEKRVAELRV